MGAIETSPNKQVLFLKLGAGFERDAIVYDPPNDAGQTVADTRHDVIEATMSSNATSAQVSEVHSKLSLRDREAYWLYRQLETHFSRAPIAEVHALRTEFEPASKDGLIIREKLDSMRDLLCNGDIFSSDRFPELLTRFHWIIDDAMKLCSDVIAAANEVTEPDDDR